MASILGMKLKQIFKPTKVVATGNREKDHPVFGGANIEEIDGRMTLVTTDGRIAMRVPVSKDHSGEEITEGYIPAHALRLIERHPFRLVEGHVEIGRSRSRVVNNKHVEGEPLVSLTRVEPGRAIGDDPEFPLVAERWPAKSRRALQISFDPKLVSKLAAGLGADALTVEIDLDKIKDGDEGAEVYEGPLVVWKYGQERPEHGAMGLVMPMREAVEKRKPEGEPDGG